MSLTAIIAGQGALPGLLAKALAARDEPFLVAEMEGAPAAVPDADVLRFRVERLVPFLEQLAQSGVGRIVMAGAVRRPRLDPELFDSRTATLVPRLLRAMQSGDDSALREVIGIFEDWDFTVVGAQDIAPDLVPGPGILAGTPTDADRADAERAAAIVTALGAVDVGQGAVVAAGLCLAVEALPGTDAMLDGVAAFRARQNGPATLRPAARTGLLYKAPKPGQDRRADLPALGPDTVARASSAGLAGIAWEAGGILLLDRAATVAAAEEHGLFLWARER